MDNTPVAARVEASLGLLLRRSTRAGLYAGLVDQLEGVNETTYPVLSGIARLEPVSSSRLAAEIGIDRTATTRYAGRLADAGLVAREPDPADARSTLLRLTERGRSTIDVARVRLVGQVEDALASWPADERAVFATVLEHFVETLRSR
ncbi:MarR family transcriptional regulator [Streptomyces sp. NPDC006733]|uniref:MarR family winged helix-turn-helix transcriptional regulator n=1 Tax=Streptomyces sp. NPDC006733 TaxID=3155460 RepID=UPI0033C2C4F6